jgi:DNA-binding transcriptional LysR family regulator
VSPTEIGLAYYDRAKTVLKDAAEADDMVTAMQAQPRGALRVSAPVSFGITHLSGAVAAFLEAYPEVEINLVLDDRFVEIVAEGFDLAIRIGTLADSSLRVRKLAESRMLLVAAPAYIAATASPLVRGADRAHAPALLEPVDRQCLAAAHRSRGRSARSGSAGG